MTKRKYIRIALSDDDNANLHAALLKFQEQTGVVMSESLFVLSLLRKAIQPN
jgi:hypothetical protein